MRVTIAFAGAVLAGLALDPPAEPADPVRDGVTGALELPGDPAGSPADLEPLVARRKPGPLLDAADDLLGGVLHLVQDAHSSSDHPARLDRRRTRVPGNQP